MSVTDSINKSEEPAPLFQSYLASVSSCSVPAPIGVFWDIENCGIPFHKSALGFVQKIRDRFFESRKEAEFMCVCDTSNQNRDTVQELNDAQVTVVHISAVSKNTADDKIRQSLRRFAADHNPPADVILISGDVNFASDLSDLRYRHHIHIILIHRKQVSVALTSCAHESYCFEDFVEELPTRSLPQTEEVTRELVVSNLPVGASVQNGLQRLCKSVRGRILRIDGTTALLRFPSNEATSRAQKRLNGESIMGQRIRVSFPQMENEKNNGGDLRRQKQPGTTSTSTPNSFHVAYSVTKLRGSAAAAGSSSSQGSLSFMHNSGAMTGRRDKLENTDRLTTENGIVETAQRPEAQWTSAEVLTGDIVIEEEEEKEEECGESKENVSSGVSSMPPVAVVMAGRVSVLPLMDIDIKPTRLQTETAQDPEKPKNRKKPKCKTTSSVENPLPLEGALQRVAAEKPKCSASASFLDSTLQRQTAATDSRMASYSSVRTDGDKTNNAGHSFFNWFRGTSTIEDTVSGSRVNPCDQSFYRKEDAGFPRTWQQTSGFEHLGELHPKASSFARSDSGRIHPSCNSFYEGQNSGQFLPNIGDGEKNFGDFKSTDLWRSSTPTKFPFEGVHSPVTFRRTPGARRPKDGRRANDCSVLPGHLVSSAAETKSSCSASFSRNSANSPTEKEFRRPLQLHDGVEVIVSNLDYNISTIEWRKILTDEFRQHVQVVDVQMRVLQDNTSVAYVRVPCIEDARCAISHFHRKKIGYKRIHVALVSSESPVSVASVRAEVAGLLHEVSGNRLPLFQFIEMFEKRFQRRISVSELYHMRDTVDIIEQDVAGRTVVLLPVQKDNASSSGLTGDNAAKPVESSVCRVHWSRSASNFTDAVDMYDLPHVVLQLRTFSAQVHKLLQSHDGSLPLVSFPSCFAAEFGELKTAADGGIALEHLVTCVPGVQLSLSEGGIKSVQWAENRSSPSYNDNIRQSCSSPGGVGQQMSQFVHEVIDLLKNCPQCRLSFSKFIPAYHHHFGHQLRVADFGFTKLMELFEAVPHVVQIIGNGCQKYVTLTHKTQVKRFIVDLLRVLKSHSSKQINLVDLPVVYHKVIGRTFDITEYGVCFLEDLVGELPDSSFTTIGTGLDMIIALPKREQTSEEVEKTKQFAREAVDLLRHSPQSRMSFSKFIPAYHHHFGKQCRVADYGFTKLMELFEAIPGVIKILDQQNEKILCLTEQELIRILEDQVASLLHSCARHRIDVSDFHAAYTRAFGHPLRLSDFEVKSVANLVEKIPNVAKIVADEDGRSFVCLVDRTQIQVLARNVLLILMDLTDGGVLLETLADYYRLKFGCGLDVNSLTSDLQGLVEITTSDGATLIKLTPLQMFARDVRTLLLASNCQLHLNQFERSYSELYSVTLSPASYGFPNVLALLQAVPHVVTFRGKGCRRMLVLMQQFRDKLVHQSTPELAGDLSNSTASKSSKSDTPSSDSGYAGTKERVLVAADDQELVAVLSPGSVADLLSDPVPSCVPSPGLFPQCPRRPASCLMHFDMLPLKQDFLMLSEDEKFGLMTPLCRTPVSDMLAFAAQLLPMDLHRRISPKGSSREENETVLLSIMFPGELRTDLPPAGANQSEDICACSGCVEPTGEDLGMNREVAEMDKSIVKEENAVDVNCSVMFGLNGMPVVGGPDNLDVSEIRAGNEDLVGDDFPRLQELVLSDEESVKTDVHKSPADMEKVHLSSEKSEEALPSNTSLSVSKGERHPILVNSPASRTTRKQDSIRRSRIAARFDVSPISSGFSACPD